MNIKTLCVSLAFGTMMLTPAVSAEYEFKLHHFLSAKAPSHSKVLEPWARAVESNSNGKVKITLYPSMTLGGRPSELVNQARDGVVDIIWTVNGYTAGLFPRTEVFELPGIHTNDPVATNLAMYDMLDSDLRQEYKGLEVMFLHTHRGNGLHMRKDSIRTPADLQGKKLRIPTRTGAWIIESLGATPIGMPVPALPQSLQKGIVDGAFIPWQIIPTLKIQQQTKYQIEMANGERFGTIIFQVSMNKARWNSLPADIQKAFRDASGRDWVKKVGQIWSASDDFGIGIATKAGNEHIVLSESESQAFKTAMEPVVDRWISEISSKGIDGKSLVDKARKNIANNK